MEGESAIWWQKYAFLFDAFAVHGLDDEGAQLWDTHFVVAEEKIFYVC